MLLNDRFRLAVHEEKRDLPIFALARARTDGRLGPQLKKADLDCAAYLAGPHAPPEPGQLLRCAGRISPGSVSGQAISMAELARSLALFVNRFTVDRTELTGSFDINLTWTPEPSPSPVAGNTAPEGPPLLNALQEQLGLKLVSERGPVDVLVIDHIEPPSEN